MIRSDWDRNDEFDEELREEFRMEKMPCAFALTALKEILMARHMKS